MEKYIPLDAVLAKIEKLFEKAGNSLGEYRNGAEHTLISIKDFLDTLEVKEVDLEKEIKEVQREYKTIEEYEGYPCTMYANDIEWIARHFFELGMQVSNKEQKRVSEDLEIASVDYAATGEFLPNGKEMIDFQIEKAFKAGAKWQKEKVLKGASNGRVNAV